MVRLAQERVLLIGDPHRQVHASLSQALPGAQLTSVPSHFDGIAELVAHTFTAVVAAAEPIERRPEAAVRQLRELVGEGRVVLFGHPTLELLSRKMLEFGADDYLITPASAGEIEQIFRAQPVRRTKDESGAPSESIAAIQDVSSANWLGSSTFLADVMLDALTHSPQDAIGAAIKLIAAQLPPGVRLVYQKNGSEPAVAGETGIALCEHPVHVTVNEHEQQVGAVQLLMADAVDQAPARSTARRLANLFAKLTQLQDRHNGLKKLAFTDDLTGLFNARYFRWSLSGLINRARTEHFPVTLLLFDIDDFKKYNDQFGHGAGDEILKQTAALMRQCTREHDVVARIGGDEFAVVFVDKEGPRQPRVPGAAQPGPHRPPQTPEQVFNRFKRMIEDEKFPVLGASGKGVLGISAGMAVYPYDAPDAAGLIKEADNRLMHGAKKRGKNSLVIVGTDQPMFPPSEAKP